MNLRFDISQLRDDCQHVDRTYRADAFPPDESFRVASDVRLVFDAQKRNDEVHLTGAVRAALETPCSRCLEPIALPVDATFDLRYVQASAQVEGADEREVSDEDAGTTFYEGHEIDLGELMREQFYLALPMKPLCKSDCAGLCPECGGNLNQTACRCEHRWVDPRMAPLEALLSKKKPS